MSCIPAFDGGFLGQGLLSESGKGIVFRQYADDRAARPIRGYKGGGYIGDAGLYLKAGLGKRLLEKGGAFDFLVSYFGIIPDLKGYLFYIRRNGYRGRRWRLSLVWCRSRGADGKWDGTPDVRRVVRRWSMRVMNRGQDRRLWRGSN